MAFKDVLPQERHEALDEDFELLHKNAGEFSFLKDLSAILAATLSEDGVEFNYAGLRQAASGVFEKQSFKSVSEEFDAQGDIDIETLCPFSSVFGRIFSVGFDEDERGGLTPKSGKMGEILLFIKGKLEPLMSAEHRAEIVSSL